MELALFDLDNTLLAGDSDYEWARFLVEQGVVDGAEYERRNDEFFTQYKAGTLNIFEFLEFQLAPLAAHTRAELDLWHARFMDQKIRPIIKAKGRRLVEEHRAAGHLLAIVTATNEFVTRPIARELGIEHLLATEIEEQNGAFTGRPRGTPTFREGKVARLDTWLAARGKPLDAFRASWFYTDSLNDIPLLERVSKPVAVDPDAKLEAVAIERGWPVISLL